MAVPGTAERCGGHIERLFTRFDEVLKSRGYLAMGGQIVDASIIQAPRQRMTKEEKETIKEDWKEKPAKLRQKDRDARWMVKTSKAKQEGMADFGIPYFGYKNHLTSDRRYGFVRRYEVTAANCHDGHVLPKILDKGNMARVVWPTTRMTMSVIWRKMASVPSFIARNPRASL